jgi:hypothetical protein
MSRESPDCESFMPVTLGVTESVKHVSVDASFRNRLRRTVNAPRWQRIVPLLATVVLALAAFAQTQPPQDKTRFHGDSNLFLNEDIEKKTWANAKPYLDFALPQMQAAVPELKGLNPANSQEDRSSLLDRVGEKCVDLLRHTPNVISHEDVITQERMLIARSPGYVRPRIHAEPERQRFEYLQLSHQTPSGGMLEERRTDKRGRSVTAEGIGSQGFASEWVRLYPGNRSESRFRYLGQQEVDKHRTIVLAFAQIPELVKFPTQFLLPSGTTVSVLIQGVVWIDSSDFRIVRMREDLLASLPNIRLEKLTTKVRFAEVRMPRAGVSLWLPQEATVEWEFDGTAVEQRHLYSDYRLFAATAKILPAAP